MTINLIEFLKNKIKNHPNKIAINDNVDVISFLQLDEFSDKIALAISDKNNISRSPIAVFMPKNCWSVIAFVGVFAAVVAVAVDVVVVVKQNVFLRMSYFSSLHGTISAAVLIFRWFTW